MKKLLLIISTLVIVALIFVVIQQKKMNDQIAPISKKYREINKKDSIENSQLKIELELNLNAYNRTVERSDTAAMSVYASIVAESYRRIGDEENALDWEKKHLDLEYYLMQHR